MEVEPWDELMGPSPEDLKNLLQSNETQAAPPAAAAPPVLHTPSKAPPPASMFQSTLSSRWQDDDAAETTPNTAVNSSYASSSSNSVDVSSTSSSNARRNLAFEDEDAAAIRQEALKVLEVADGKRKPRAAFDGLDYTINRHTSSASVPAVHYTDHPQDSYEDTVVDVVGMERRSMGSRTVEQPTNNKWSSRYSTDSALLALSGGAAIASSRKVLDQMDNDHLTRTNLFGKKNNAPKVFGKGGFQFRKNKVYGKQNVTLPTENLRTVWMDIENNNDSNGNSLPPSAPAKSWQAQLQQKRQQRRRYILACSAVAVFLIGLGSILGTQHRQDKTSISSSLLGDNEAATIYVAYGDPQELELDQITPQASFLVHLGDLQDASDSLCEEDVYTNAAAALEQAPISTFVLPGVEDVLRCPSPESAWTVWQQTFRFFHRRVDHDFPVQSQSDHLENFSVVENGVLFIGVHLVRDRHVDSDEDFDIQWVVGMIKAHAANARAVVVFANSSPTESRHDAFVSQMVSTINLHMKDKPAAYVYGGDREIARVHTNMMTNVVAIQVPQDKLQRMSVGFGENPFILG